MYDTLFSPFQIGTVTLKNRLIMSSVGSAIPNFDGTPSAAAMQYFTERAAGGVGAIITEVTRVNEEHGVAVPKQFSMAKDRHIEPMRALTDRVHTYGTKIFCQLQHPGRQNHTVLAGGKPCLAPSAVMCKYSESLVRAMTNAEIKSMVLDFVNAGVRAMRAGFDGVEIHAAHGYLVGQFMSPYTNKRTDEYGGSFENRMRFVKEIIEGLRAECGKHYPISVRFDADEFLEHNGVTEDYLHAEDCVKTAKFLEACGVDALNVSCGIYETMETIIEPTAYQQGWRSYFIRAVKENVSIPVIGTNAVREPAVAEQLILDGVQDCVNLGRALLADPEWPNKAREGRESEIRKCIGCMRCFETLNTHAAYGAPPECSVNPRAFKETRFPEPVPPMKGQKTVAVIGAGPAGMCAALTAAQRGAKVVLFEKSDRLGGLVNYACASPLKHNMHWIIDWYAQELPMYGVDVRLNTEASIPALKQLDPDAVIVATGAKPLIPGGIPGADKKHVFGFKDVLSGASGLKDKTVAIVGAGITGLECGAYLNAEGCKTFIVDMAEKVAPNDYIVIVNDDCRRLREEGTTFHLRHALEEIRDDAIVCKDLQSGKIVTFPCDAVILSLGIVSETGMVKELKENFKNVHVVGGADKVGGKIPGATNSAYQCVYELFGHSKGYYDYLRYQLSDLPKMAGFYLGHLKLCTPAQYQHMVLDAIKAIRGH